MSEFKVKVVGLSFHKIESPVKESDYVILRADPSNEFDSDAVAVFNGGHELVGHVANSDKTLSVNNRINGNISATELKEKLDFSNKEYYAEAVKVYNSCIYLEVNDGKWSFINSTDEEPDELAALKSEVESLKAIVEELQNQVISLKTLVTVGGEDNSSPTTSDGRTLITFVGLSHYDGQNHLGYDLSIVEEPIFPNAKGTSLFLKSGDYRIGVAPSIKKKDYCKNHNIPYCDSKKLKEQSFDGQVIIEEIVYDEYAVVSI